LLPCKGGAELPRPDAGWGGAKFSFLEKWIWMCLPWTFAQWILGSGVKLKGIQSKPPTWSIKMEKWELLKLGRTTITTFSSQGKTVTELKEYLRYRNARPKTVIPLVEENMEAAIVEILTDGYEPFESVVDKDGLIFFYLFRRRIP